MPKIFQSIDTQMRERLVGERTENISPQIPPGMLKYGERWVESRAITFPNHISSCFIRGKLDGVIAFDNGTYGVVDYKTSKPSKKHQEFYFRQLNSYAYSLQNAGKGKFSLHPITKLGLLIFEPQSFDHSTSGQARLDGELTWIEVDHNPNMFVNDLSAVLKVLESIEPPPADSECKWCQYRETILTLPEN